MTRARLSVTIAAIIVAVVAMGVAAALLSDRREPSHGSQARRPAINERAREAEDHNVGDLTAVEAAARRFLGGYLPLIYGKPGAAIDELPSASPRLITRLEAEGGHVTPAQAERAPRLQQVAVIRDGAIGALATAQIKDSPSPAYPLVFHLQKTPEGWVVTRIGGP